MKFISALLNNSLIYAKYGFIFSITWIVLTRGDAESWVIGIAIVPLATWLAVHLFSSINGYEAMSFRVAPFLRFIGFFLAQSLKGGWDCAKYALSPFKSVSPGFIRFKTRLPPGAPHIFFINTVSILPGTVGSGDDDQELIIHALDINADNHAALLACEEQVAILFDISIASDSNTSAGEYQ